MTLSQEQGEEGQRKLLQQAEIAGRDLLRLRGIALQLFGSDRMGKHAL